MESCIRISLSEYIDPDQSQRFDHSGHNEIWREPFPPARTCDTNGDSARDARPELAVYASAAHPQAAACGGPRPADSDIAQAFLPGLMNYGGRLFKLRRLIAQCP